MASLQQHLFDVLGSLKPRENWTAHSVPSRDYLERSQRSGVATSGELLTLVPSMGLSGRAEEREEMKDFVSKLIMFRHEEAPQSGVGERFLQKAEAARQWPSSLAITALQGAGKTSVLRQGLFDLLREDWKDSFCGRLYGWSHGAEALTTDETLLLNARNSSAYLGLNVLRIAHNSSLSMAAFLATLRTACARLPQSVVAEAPQFNPLALFTLRIALDWLFPAPATSPAPSSSSTSSSSTASSSLDSTPVPTPLLVPLALSDVHVEPTYMATIFASVNAFNVEEAARPDSRYLVVGGFDGTDRRLMVDQMQLSGVKFRFISLRPLSAHVFKESIQRLAASYVQSNALAPTSPAAEISSPTWQLSFSLDLLLQSLGAFRPFVYALFLLATYRSDAHTEELVEAPVEKKARVDPAHSTRAEASRPEGVEAPVEKEATRQHPALRDREETKSYIAVGSMSWATLFTHLRDGKADVISAVLDSLCVCLRQQYPLAFQVISSADDCLAVLTRTLLPSTVTWDDALHRTSKITWAQLERAGLLVIEGEQAVMPPIFALVLQHHIRNTSDSFLGWLTSLTTTLFRQTWRGNERDDLAIMGLLLARASLDHGDEHGRFSLRHLFVPLDPADWLTAELANLSVSLRLRPPRTFQQRFHYTHLFAARPGVIGGPKQVDYGSFLGNGNDPFADSLWVLEVHNPTNPNKAALVLGDQSKLRCSMGRLQQVNVASFNQEKAKFIEALGLDKPDSPVGYQLFVYLSDEHASEVEFEGGEVGLTAETSERVIGPWLSAMRKLARRRS